MSMLFALTAGGAMTIAVAPYLASMLGWYKGPLGWSYFFATQNEKIWMFSLGATFSSILAFIVAIPLYAREERHLNTQLNKR